MDTGREDQNPWDKWFWSDFESDFGLRACGLKAQGLWMRMLSLMAKSKTKGYLLDGTKQMESKALAKLVGESVEEIDRLIAELFEHGVPSKDLTGTIYNRRMARQGYLSKVRSEAGKKGGRPKKQNENLGDFEKSKPKAPSASASAYASASASDSASDPQNEGGKKGPAAVGKGSKTKPKNKADLPDGFEEFWKAYPRKTAKADAVKAWLALTRKNPDGTRRGDPKEVLRAVGGYLDEIAKLGTEPQFIKYPATFLRDDRWRDYISGSEASAIWTGWRPKKSQRGPDMVGAHRPKETFEDRLTNEARMLLPDIDLEYYDQKEHDPDSVAETLDVFRTRRLNEIYKAKKDGAK